MKTKIQDKITSARRDRDYKKLTVYQGILSAIQESEARLNKDLNDEQIYALIKKEEKAYLESAVTFADSKTQPTVASDMTVKAELCKELLPEMVDESDYEMIADKTISITGATSIRDMGKVIGAIKGEFGASIDAGKISAIVKEKLIDFVTS
jgi:uncharacterized protein YqeY